MVNNSIQIIHILDKNADELQIQVNLQSIANNCDATHGIKPGLIIKKGSIFTTISEVANNIKASMVIMGTHGMQGFQKLTGSWALKVLAGSYVPFFVVQDLPTNDYLQKIVVPINSKSENKEKLPWIIYLAKHYRSEILIFKDGHSSQHLSAKSNQNIQFLKTELDNKGIKYSIQSNNSKKSFAEASIDYAQQSGANLIAVMTSPKTGFKEYMMGISEQHIIANNHKIPVMCINPQKINN
jgi:nucleotide-binding universal stress UspA family protein